MFIRTAKEDHEKYFELLKACLIPRPIVLVSTLDEEGIYNVAPFSSCTTVATLPPMLCIAAGPYKGRKKDTVRNIELTHDFVVNIPDEKLADKVLITAQPFPPEIDEFREAGLTALPGIEVTAPRVAEAPVQIECRLEKILELGEIPDYLIIGRILAFHVREDLFNNYKIDFDRLRPLGAMKRYWD